MFGDKKNRLDEYRGGSAGFNQARTLWIWIAVLGLVIFIAVAHQRANTAKAMRLNQAEFLEAVESNIIVRGTIYYNLQGVLHEVEGELYKVDTAGNIIKDPQGKPVTVPFYAKVRLPEELEANILRTKKFEVHEVGSFWTGILAYGALVLLGFIMLWWFVFRQVRAANRTAMNFAKSRARLLTKGRDRVTFKDVAGIDEAVEEVREIVEFLRDPKKFQQLGGRIPKGVLLVGPPGTGKTLLAKAIAGEANAAFFSISGSDFVEMFVGVGASRVRDMFEQARKHTPCLIFIDEIDAVGRSRGYGLGGGNDEREQTLNALLVELDGFDTIEGIIVIAATNRPDVLDPALLRPGRFDRQVYVNLPDVRGREAILKVHARRVKLSSDVDLALIAKSTPGFSGAELANLVNEAALLAARRGKKAIEMEDLEEARDKVRWGRERRSLAMSENEKRVIAWHEAGHALVNVLVGNADPLHKVTIIPRGQALGATMSLPKDDVFNRKKKELLDIITMTLAGRIAEEIATGDVSTGAAADIKQATEIARAMVTQWGMSDKLGLVQYDTTEEYVFLGRDLTRTKQYSEQTAKEIDEEIKSIIQSCYERARQLILGNKDKLELIANALLEFETLAGEDVVEIVRTGVLPERLRAKKSVPAIGNPTQENPILEGSELVSGLPKPAATSA